MRVIQDFGKRKSFLRNEMIEKTQNNNKNIVNGIHFFFQFINFENQF